jgi:hypothetical protein
MAGPKLLKTNIAVPAITCGKNSLHFLPDRLLVTDGKRFSDVAYASLAAAASSGRFIEDEAIPRDGVQVDTTWRFVNVRGGPDRRFNNNRQLPVMMYGNLELTSPTGLHWLLQCSRPDGFAELARVIEAAPASVSATAEQDSTPAPESRSNETDIRPGLPGEEVGRDESAGGFRKEITFDVPNLQMENADLRESSAAPDSGDASNARSTPRVPRTDEERAALLASRPPGWEYLLFATSLLEAQRRFESKWRDYQLGISSPRGRQLNVDAAMNQLSSSVDGVQDLMTRLVQLLSPATLEKAFGQPGKSGDPNLIEHVCFRFADAWEDIIDWGQKLRDTRVPPLLAPAFQTASRFVERPLETINDFVESNIRQLDQLGERLQNNESIELTLGLVLTADDAVMNEFQQRLAAAQAAF